MNKRSIVLFLFIGLLFVVIGCTSDAEPDEETVSESTEENSDETPKKSDDSSLSDTLNIALNAQPPHLDAPRTAATASRDVARLIFETLVTLDSNYQVQPMLAESFETDDNQTFIFHLREDILFHNGETLTAEDAVASMARWTESSQILGEIFIDAQWEAKDDYTVQLTLKEPSALALDMMASPKEFAAIMPENIVESATAEGVDEYVGTGPYELIEWKQDQYIHLQEYIDYQPLDMEPDGLSGKKEALVENIYFHIVNDASTRVAGLQTGEYDFSYMLPYDSYDQIDADENLDTYLMPSGSMILQYNKGSDHITADFDVRRAINVAIDKDALMLAAFPNEESFNVQSSYMEKEIANWYSEAGSEFHNINDPELAKEILEESDYNGEEVRVLASRDYDHHYNMGVVLHEELSNIGINSVLEVYDWPTTNKIVLEDDTFEIFVVSLSTVSTPPQFLSLSSTWAGGVDDDDVLTELNNVQMSRTLEEGQETWENLQHYLWEEYLPASVIGTYSDFFAANDKVEGITMTAGPIFWNVQVYE